jgi:hypothetical protein
MPHPKFETKRISLVPHQHDSAHDANVMPERLEKALAVGWEPIVQWNSGGTLIVFLRRPID